MSKWYGIQFPEKDKQDCFNIWKLLALTPKRNINYNYKLLSCEAKIKTLMKGKPSQGQHLASRTLKVCPTHPHTLPHTCTHTRAHTPPVHTLMHTCLHSYMHMHNYPTYTHTHAPHTCTPIHAMHPTPMHTHMHSCTCTPHMNAHTHTSHTCTPMHTPHSHAHRHAPSCTHPTHMHRHAHTASRQNYKTHWIKAFEET